MVVRSLIPEKQPVIFLFRKVMSQQHHERVDKGFNLFAGKTLGEDIGEFLSSGKLQKTGKRFFIKLAGEAETNLVGLDGHRNLEGPMGGY